MKDTAKYTA